MTSVLEFFNKKDHVRRGDDFVQCFCFVCTPYMRSYSEFFSNKNHVRQGNAMRGLGSGHVTGVGQ